MSNDHVSEPFRSLLNDLTRNHRASREELREGMAALTRVNGVKMAKPRSYDPRCEDLAAAFLVDHPPFSQVEKEDLAQTIQDAIEDWLADRESRIELEGQS